jgi:hypothetical protein
MIQSSSECTAFGMSIRAWFLSRQDLYPYREFNELVNMGPDELKEWLGGEDSAGAGWSKDDGSGETIGHER